MVNYRRASEAVVLLVAAALVSTAPHHDCKDERVIDQRQNGSENYRLNIDGVVIAVAPAESLLSAISDIDLSDLLAEFDLEEQKPKPPTQVTDILIGEDLPNNKPDEKPTLTTLEEKPSETKPDDAPAEAKPQEAKPELDAPVTIPEKQQEKGHKKSAQLRKQENAQRLKHRLASIFLPFLRKRRHQ